MIPWIVWSLLKVKSHQLAGVSHGSLRWQVGVPLHRIPVGRPTINDIQFLNKLLWQLLSAIFTPPILLMP